MSVTNQVVCVCSFCITFNIEICLVRTYVYMYVTPYIIVGGHLYDSANSNIHC